MLLPALTPALKLLVPAEVVESMPATTVPCELLNVAATAPPVITLIVSAEGWSK